MSKQYPTHSCKKIAWLIDPEKEIINDVFKAQIQSVPDSQIILVGGSTCSSEQFQTVVSFVYEYAFCLVLIFPGSNQQISSEADGILLLSLVSGNNPNYLITQHIEAAQALKKSNLVIYPTGYLLIDGGIISSANKVTATNSIPSQNIGSIVNTSLAATQLGMSSIYLEAGSGALNVIDFNTIFRVRKNITKQTLWVGGGIKTKEQITLAHKAGANVVVIGNAIENNPDLLKQLF
ncbi:MAG: geranylgeranylglyceryl phosphate synthase family protein [Flavobacteriales bacterium]|jgi:geranylgeranylglyceryl phosphate synthase family protein